MYAETGVLCYLNALVLRGSKSINLYLEVIWYEKDGCNEKISEILYD